MQNERKNSTAAISQVRIASLKLKNEASKFNISVSIKANPNAFQRIRSDENKIKTEAINQITEIKGEKRITTHK